MIQVDYVLLQKELVRVLRGKISQERLSQKMGLRGNSTYRWENGAGSMSWTQFVSLCKVTRYDLQGALRRVGFFGDVADAKSLLTQICSTESPSLLSKKLGYSRFKIARWLNGQSIPSLTEVFKVLDISQLLILFVEGLVSFNALPSMSELAKWREKLQEAYLKIPELEAVLRVMDLADYLAMPVHKPGVIAQKIGISLDIEKQCIHRALELGLISESGGKYRVNSTYSSASLHIEGLFQLRKYWMNRGLESMHRLEKKLPEQIFSRSGHCLVGVSRDGELKILTAYQEFLNSVRNVCLNDKGPKVSVKLCQAQILDLSECSETKA